MSGGERQWISGKHDHHRYANIYVSLFDLSLTLGEELSGSGPFKTTLTGDLITALPTWTGLTSYLDQITPDTGASSQTPTLGSGEGYGYAKPTNVLDTIHISSTSSSANVGPVCVSLLPELTISHRRRRAAAHLPLCRVMFQLPSCGEPYSDC